MPPARSRHRTDTSPEGAPLRRPKAWAAGPPPSEPSPRFLLPPAYARASRQGTARELLPLRGFVCAPAIPRWTRAVAGAVSPAQLLLPLAAREFRPVVPAEEDDGILLEAELFERVQDPPDSLVSIRNRRSKGPVLFIQMSVLAHGFSPATGRGRTVDASGHAETRWLPCKPHGLPVRHPFQTLPTSTIRHTRSLPSASLDSGPDAIIRNGRWRNRPIGRGGQWWLPRDRASHTDCASDCHRRLPAHGGSSNGRGSSR